MKSWQKDFKIKSADAHNLQRPETVESLFLLFRVTEDPIYRKWGWEIFKSFKKHMFVTNGEGYTSLDDVTTIPSPMRDNMESFWLVIKTASLGPAMGSVANTHAGRDFEISLPPFLSEGISSADRGCFLTPKHTCFLDSSRTNSKLAGREESATKPGMNTHKHSKYPALLLTIPGLRALYQEESVSHVYNVIVRNRYRPNHVRQGQALIQLQAQLQAQLRYSRPTTNLLFLV